MFYGSFFALFLCFFCLIFFLISYIVYYKCDCSCTTKKEINMMVLVKGSKNQQCLNKSTNFSCSQKSSLLKRLALKKGVKILQAMFSTSNFAFAVLILFSIKLVVGSEECPPWFTLENTTGSLFPQCVCSTDNQPWIICKQILQKSYLNLGYCAFQDTATNGTLVAACPYVFPKHLIVDGLIPLPSKVSQLNNFTCGNLCREISFPLCGRCANGTGPAIYYFGSKCVPCSAVNILYYLLLQYLPNTIMFLAIIVQHRWYTM